MSSSMSLAGLLLVCAAVATFVDVVSSHSEAFATTSAGFGLRLRGAGPQAEDVTIARGFSSRGSARFSSQESSSFSSSTMWLSMAAALAGATLSARHRFLTQSRALSPEAEERKRRFRLLEASRKPRRSFTRHVKTYGGNGPPRAPRWLPGWQPDPNDEKQKNLSPLPKPRYGPACPPWMTYERWQTFGANVKCRSIRWWKRSFDSNGNRRINPKETYTIAKAIDIIFDMYNDSPSEMDPTLECMMRMALDPKYPDQQIRLNISLPHGTGQAKRVAVFCPPDEEEEVLKMGAYKAGKTLQDELEQEEFDFDVLIAKPAMMPALAKLGKILGPRRLMPSPKSGTVVQDLQAGIQNWLGGGAIELRNNSCMMVGCACGKISMGKQKCIENFRAVLKGLADKAPPGAVDKKVFWKVIYLGSTQTPSMRIAESEWPNHSKGGGAGGGGIVKK
eukprot:gb/GFBE01066720.1/.p1 GENE.gb/GFBE01066720.1/~~gb/GFBE01066720.1/.p1  ORF type:complete len:448 (+),score=112.44 gb/GFBE01066720.1/:1-1344(+)